MRKNIYILFLLCFAPSLFAQTAKQIAKYLPNRLIVKLKPFVFEKENALSNLKESIGFEEIKPLFAQKINQSDALSNYYEIVFDEKESLESISKRLYETNLIEHIEPISYYESLTPPFVPNDVFYTKGLLWGHDKAKVPQAWEISKGDSNIVIGIIDAYAYTNHLEFRGQMKFNHKERYGIRNYDDDGNGFVDDSLGYDFAEGNYMITGWHGTAVAGIAAAKVNNGIGVAGVGFNCRFMPIKVQDERRNILSLNVVKAIRYAVDNGCKIINLSLGGVSTNFSKLEQEVINYANHKGVLIIAAAGNDAGEFNLFPASYENVLSVAASDANDRNIGSNSNFIDLLAPGKDIWTTNIYPYPDEYVMHYGSSFAVPFVAGAAGLVKARFPDFTPLQIAEQLRATADDVYQVAGNAAFAERIGRGRINVLRAVQDRNIAQSVRVKNAKFTDKFGNYAFPDDTVALVCDFINYLKPSSSALKATLSSTSSYVRIIKNTVKIGALSTMDSLNNAKEPFLVYINPQTPPNTIIKFRVGFEDSSYTDYQYFNVETSTDYLDMYFNDFSLTSAADGRMGLVGQSANNGIGIVYQGKQVLKDAGLMISSSPSKVANSIIVNNSTRADDFKAVNHIKFVSKDLQSLAASATFKDANKIGLEITQTIKGRINQPHQKYLLVDYDIVNKGSQLIDSLSVGLFADWNIAGGYADFANWDEKEKFGYVFQEGAKTYLGIKVLGEELQYYAIDKIRNDGNLNFIDGFSDNEKYITLNNDLKNKEAGYSAVYGSDVAHVVSTKIRKLGQGQSKKITFAILGGSNLEDLRKASQQAQIMANPNAPKGKAPIVPTLLCRNEKMFVRPSNGTNFRFYEESNLKAPKSEGKEFEVSLADTAKVFYISNIDSLVESNLVKYQFKVHQAKAKFSSIDSLNIVDSSAIYFSDKSTKAVKWSWNFGDGTKKDTIQNPKHEFNQIGSYKITLTITDSVGCEASFSKTVKIVRMARSPLPMLSQYEILVCRTEPVIVAPSNGQKFRFYTSYPLATPVWSGKTYIITDTNIKKIYITNIDSTFESKPIVLTIGRRDLTANFDYSPKADTITNNQITFKDLSTTSLFITKWEWNFGDGSPADFSRNPSRRFNKQGIYKVFLKVTDLAGCTDTISKFFRVGNKSPNPIVSNQTVCKGASVTLNPTNGTKFKFYTSLPLSTPVHSGQSYSFTPTASSILYVTNADSIIESNYQTVSIEVNEPKAAFTTATEILLYRSNSISQFQDLSKNAVSWSWNFGDGSPISKEKNPNYQYKKQGEYEVRLSIIDIYGCEASTSMKVKVFNRAKPPQISGVTICKDAPVMLRPTGGKKFRFYETYPSALILFSGEAWNLGKVAESKTYYVTCIDSLHESEATKVEIKVDEITADFDIKFVGESAFAGDTLYFQPKSKNAIVWEWFMGDGTASYRNNPFRVYKNAGNYGVTLNIGNATGCVASMTKILTVKEKTIIPPNIKVFLYPNPTDGEIKMEVSTLKFTPVYIELYNALGQRLDVLTKDMIKNEIYKYSLQGREKGVYMLRLTFDGETFVKKVIYQ
ncbi:MAG: PKD domain-containing protein [Cytophagales bacterium]|nr:MAG: PKD domain-containing protein [Cytophagales bacterium]